MADNKKYYYIKLKEDYFEDETQILLESMPDGYLYSNILLKLYLKSLKNDGKLMCKNGIPYSPQMIATVTRHQVGTVEKALKIFKDLNIIEIVDTGYIYMTDIQNFIGKSSTEADRKRDYRNRVEKEKMSIKHIMGHLSTECPTECPLENRDKRLENRDNRKEKIYKKEKKKIETNETSLEKTNKPKNKYGKFQRIELTSSEYKKLIEDYGEKFINKQINSLDEYIESNNNKNSYTNFDLILRKSIREKWYNTADEITPNWFDEELEENKPTEKEQQELDDLLSDF